MRDANFFQKTLAVHSWLYVLLKDLTVARWWSDTTIERQSHALTYCGHVGSPRRACMMLLLPVLQLRRHVFLVQGSSPYRQGPLRLMPCSTRYIITRQCLAALVVATSSLERVEVRALWAFSILTSNCIISRVRLDGTPLYHVRIKSQMRLCHVPRWEHSETFSTVWGNSLDTARLYIQSNIASTW